MRTEETASPYHHMCYFALLSIICWASKTSPTLGCSIKILCDIYVCICRYVFDCLWENNTKNCILKCVGGIT